MPACCNGINVLLTPGSIKPEFASDSLYSISPGGFWKGLSKHAGDLQCTGDRCHVSRRTAAFEEAAEAAAEAAAPLPEAAAAAALAVAVAVAEAAAAAEVAPAADADAAALAALQHKHHRKHLFFASVSEEFEKCI